MIRHGRQNDNKVRAGALALVATLCALALPASALAWDSPLEPVTPAGDNTAQHGAGLIRPAAPQALSAATINDVQAQAADLPASVDLTQWAMPVGDQGQVGSCAAWATDYSAMGYWMNKQDIDGTPLAPMFTYSQYTATYTGGRDEGSTLDFHPQVAKTTGVDSLADYQPQGNYDFHTQPTAAQKTSASQWKVTSYASLPVQQSVNATVTQNSIKAALADGKPVVIGMPIFASFNALRASNGGYYNAPATPGADLGGHAVTALGYDSTGIRIQNQWGTWWGDSGWATLSWAFVNKYVFQAMEVGSLVDSDPQPKVLSNPVVSGTLTRGETLNASNGAYTATPNAFAYQWQRDNQDISGATTSSYTLSESDVSSRVRVVVTATNPTGSARATSAAVGPVSATLPTSTTAPVLSGTAKRGEVLTVNKGQWTDNPTAWNYVWQRDKGTGYQTISGATLSVYTLTASDLTARIRVNVSARNAVGTSAPAASNALGAVGPNAPVNIDRPELTGTPKRGVQLASNLGNWGGAGNVYRYQWQRYANNAWASIAGATTPVYTPPLADEGMTLRMQVTATNGDGSAIAVSDATVAVAASPPTVTTIPPPGGTASRGSALTADPGPWDGAGNTYRYQWQRRTGNGAWTSINAAIYNAYTLQLADEGANLRVQVTATNVDGTATGSSQEVGPVSDAPPFNNAPPIVAGMPARGQTLSTTTGNWTGANNIYTYQWQHDAGSGWQDISGATKNSYVLQKSDEFASMRVRVTATNVDDAIVAASDPTAAVAASPPVNTILPIVTGIVARTKPLSASQGSWSGPNNVYSFQWQRDTGSGFADIPGATSSVYVITANDVAANLRIKVTAVNLDATVVAYSLSTAGVDVLPPQAGGVPVVTGIAKTGQTVATTNGSWTPAGPTFDYQWQSDTGSGFMDISGATNSTYVLTDNEVTAKVRAKVTATNEDGSTVAYSTALGPIIATPVNTQLPAITGTLTDNEVQTADKGVWASAGNLSHTYRYQWVRCSASATTTAGCNSIANASAATYTTTTSDVGSKLGVKVTATNSQGVPAVASSGLTNVIQGRALANVAPPEIVGLAQVREKLTVTTGEWTVALTRATYQWMRCDADGTNCVDIPAAFSSAYTPTPTDVGKALVVRINVASAGRTSVADSTPSAPIAALPIPTTTDPVTLSGAAARAQTLRATMPKWAGYPTQYAYEWLRCDAAGASCTPIPGAKGNAYILTKDDEGSTVRVTMSATNSAGTGDSTSDPSAVVAPVQAISSVVPSIGGSPIQNQMLTANKGVWSTTADTTYAFVWLRCLADGSGCVSIPGAITAYYRPTADDIDLVLKVSVTATNADGDTTAVSNPSAKIKPAAPTANPAPTLVGVAQVGKLQTVEIGTWTNVSSTPKVTFWRCTTACVAIVTSTAKTYTLSSADAGFRIRASVTGVGAGGTTTIYATAIVGPVKAPTAGSLVASSAPTALKSSTGAKLATVAAKTPTAGGTATVSVTPSKSLAKGYKAWACPTGEFSPCTKPVKLSRKATKLKLAVDAGEKVSVVVAKIK